MRLTCPECDAQYEVEDSLIPPGGRSVECARCGHMWHQPGRAAEAIRLGDAELTAEIPARDDEEARPRTSAAALEILREEAARELAARAAARARAQERATVAAADRDDPPPEFIVAEVVDDRELPAPSVAAPSRPDHAVASLEWRELPPDAAADHPDSFAQTDRPAAVARPTRASQGYGAGFGLALAVTAAAVALYLSADAGDGPLGAYRATVDGARLWLHGLVFGGS